MLGQGSDNIHLPIAKALHAFDVLHRNVAWAARGQVGEKKSAQYLDIVGLKFSKYVLVQ